MDFYGLPKQTKLQDSYEYVVLLENLKLDKLWMTVGVSHRNSLALQHSVKIIDLSTINIRMCNSDITEAPKRYSERRPFKIIWSKKHDFQGLSGTKALSGASSTRFLSFCYVFCVHPQTTVFEIMRRHFGDRY
jgi:hypothetical protein